jgi:GDP-4-dehydro-6-deoxy-D-mannose reductase
LRFLITGVGGFAGSHLADHLLAGPNAGGAAAPEVWGCDLSSTRRPFHPPDLQLLAADLCQPEAARHVIETARPDAVFHLAGQAFVGDSWADPWKTLETNLRAQVNLLEAVMASGLRPRVLVVGSADEYGPVTPEELPLAETHELRPDSPYSVSKVGQDLLGLQYFLSYRLPVIRVRPFNHIGPRQNPRFVAPAFASQIAAIEAGQQPPVLKVGNLSARRDFTDVRDVVRAYALLVERGEAGEVYNIGSGRSRPITDLLEGLLSLATVDIRVEPDDSRMRVADVPDLVCDATRLAARTGWQPRIPLEQTLSDLPNYERARRAEAAPAAR